MRYTLLFAAALLGTAACGGTSDTSGPTASEAQKEAVGLSGGTASDEAQPLQEDGHDLWRIYVDMENGARLEVLLFADSGELFEIADSDGPFDYDALDPLPGQLTYAEARDVAQATVAGEQIAWEVKYKDGPYFYEFYVEDSGAQLWEVKLWASSGEVFVTEAKDAVD